MQYCMHYCFFEKALISGKNMPNGGGPPIQFDYVKDNCASEEIEAAKFQAGKMEILKIDHTQQRYPYCIGKARRQD